MPRFLTAALLLTLAACSVPGGRRWAPPPAGAPDLAPDATVEGAPGRALQASSGRSRDTRRASGDLVPGQTVLQGYFGATLVDELEFSGGDPEYLEDPDIAQMPVIGGGGQWVMGGGRVDIGLEGGLAFNFRTNGGAFVAGGGGAVVAVSVDLWLLDLYGGFFASTALGSKWRWYGGVGPLMQFTSYSQEGDGIDDSSSGFGLGWYVRTGLEYAVSRSTMIGLGARWSESTIDMSGDLGDLDLSGTQVFFSVTRGF